MDQQENTARKEMVSNIILTRKPTGFQQVSFPLTQNAQDEINKLKNKQVNWVQLTLDDRFTNLSCVTSKTITESAIHSSVDQTKPQFYLFDNNNSLVFIYFFPEKSGTSIKNRMVYSTCKASLADQIKELGFPVIKKMDVRSIEELNLGNIRESTSTNFRPTEQMLNPVKSEQEDPYNRSSNPRSRFLGNNNSSYGSSFRVLTAGRGSTLPKGVVLPPPGAYC